MTIGTAIPQDVDELVRVHIDAFQGFFLTRLGPRFLRELYRGFVSEQDAICLVARDEQGIAGFVVGVSHPATFFRGLLIRRWLPFIVAAVPALLRQPGLVARKLFGAIFYRGTEPKGHEGGTLLSSLAVAPRAEGQGIGSRLVTEFVNVSAGRGAPLVYLTTDRDGNDPVNRFYQRAGFELVYSFLNHRRWMNLYVKKLN